MSFRSSIAWAFTGACAALFGACAPEFDTTRKPIESSSFGNKVFTLVCKRVAYQEDLNDGDGFSDVSGNHYREVCRSGDIAPETAPDKVRMLVDRRAQLSGAIDAAIPEALRARLQSVLVAITTLADDGTIQRTIEKTALAIQQMEDDPEFLSALARTESRVGYRPLSHVEDPPISPAVGILSAISRYQGLDLLLKTHIAAIAAPEGGSGGSAAAEFRGLIAAISSTLKGARAVSDSASPNRTLKLALDLFFSESDDLGTGNQAPLVRRDHRGMARVAQGAFSNPGSRFSDANGDALADVDSSGNYVTATGQGFRAPSPFSTPVLTSRLVLPTRIPATPPVGSFDPIPPPAVSRDNEGRALLQNGSLMYSYIDLDRTVLAALFRESVDLFNPTSRTINKLLHGTTAMLGARNPNATRLIGDDLVVYRGFDTTNAPVLDIIWAALQLMKDPKFDDTIQIVRQLFAKQSTTQADIDREHVTARLIASFMEAFDMGKAHPEAVIAQNSMLFDELTPLLVRMLKTPGLTQDVLKALENPQFKELNLLLAKHMKYSDEFTVQPTNLTVGGSFSRLVQRGGSATDSGANRSIMQKLLHVIADSRGKRFCSKANAKIKLVGIPLRTFDSECDLFQIDDGAVFYLQTMVYKKDASGNVVYQDGRPVTKGELRLRNLGVLQSLVTDSLLESMSGIPGFTSHPTTQAMNRVLFSPTLPEFLADQIEPMRCKWGDLYNVTHRGSLTTWEKDGFLDKVRPLVQAFADHDSEGLFVDILSVVHRHYATPQSLDHQFTAPSERNYSAGSGAVRYEPLIIDMIEHGDLLNALTDLLPTISALRTSANRSARDVLVDAALYLFEQKSGTATRGGATTLKGSDGRTNVSPLSPYLLFAEAYKNKRAIVAASPEAAMFSEGTSQLIDQLFKTEKVQNKYRFRNRRMRHFMTPVIDFLRQRRNAHVLANDLNQWLTTGVPRDIEQAVTSPLFASMSDFLITLDNDMTTRAQIDAMLRYMTDQLNNPEVFHCILISAADLLQTALDDGNMVPIAKRLGAVIAPDTGVVDQQITLLRKIYVREEHAGVSGTLSELVRNMFAEYLPGQTPATDIFDALNATFRANPVADEGKPFSSQDFRDALSHTRNFLNDHRRGFTKFVEIIKLRNLD